MIHRKFSLTLLDGDVKGWRHLAEGMIEVAEAALKQEGCVPARAPKMPKVDNLHDEHSVGLEGGYIREPYRVLCYWVPEWNMGPDAGRWKLRVDTLLHAPLADGASA